MIPPPNFTQTPNILFDEIMRDMNESELKVFLAIVRKTFGWKKERDRISLTQIMEMTGLSRPSVLSGIHGKPGGDSGYVPGTGLVQKGLINLYSTPSGSEYEIRVEDTSEVKQVYQSGKETLPLEVKQVDLQKKPSKETIQKKEERHRHGEYKHVLLTTPELERFKVDFPLDWQQRIMDCDEYCQSSGKRYADYNATMRNWARRDQQKGKKSAPKISGMNYDPNQPLFQEVKM